jgi:hypothetical protein
MLWINVPTVRHTGPRIFRISVTAATVTLLPATGIDGRHLQNSAPLFQPSVWMSAARLWLDATVKRSQFAARAGDGPTVRRGDV